MNSHKPLPQPVMVNEAGQIVATFPDFAGMTEAEIVAAIRDALSKDEKLPGHWDESVLPFGLVEIQNA